jgi:hypothetical protein
MGQGKRALAVTRGGPIQIEKAGVIGVSSTLPVTRCRDFGCRKEGTFPIKRLHDLDNTDVQYPLQKILPEPRKIA